MACHQEIPLTCYLRSLLISFPHGGLLDTEGGVWEGGSEEDCYPGRSPGSPEAWATPFLDPSCVSSGHRGPGGEQGGGGQFGALEQVL